MENYKERYDHALETVQEILSSGADAIRIKTLKRRLQSVFPELKEKESEDERIKKTIIRILKGEISYTSKEDIDKYVTWLEKQDEKKPNSQMEKCSKCQFVYTGYCDGTCILENNEQKPVDKVEPKFEPQFKVGDGITDGYIYYKITEILDDRYIIESKYDKRGAILFEHENRYHLWTIEDAKDGDVLVNGSNIFIFHFINGTRYFINGTRLMGYCHVNVDDNKFYIDNDPNTCFGTIDAEFTVASQEQRDILFAKMKEAGYEWDSKKKELNKIEQKTADKTEPKFKVRDWILNDVCFPLQIASIRDGMYVFTEGDAISVSFVDEHLHLWTIQDAMDGDVLINWNNTIFIFKAIEDETVKYHIAYNENWDAVKTPSTKSSHLGLPEPQFGLHPATKEQRELLFSKMKEAGYQWDAKKKTLKKIEEDGVEYKKHITSELVNLAITAVEQKSEPAWSDEDEKIRNLLIDILNVNHPNGYFKVNPANTSNMEAIHVEEFIDWLKSIKSRVQPHSLTITNEELAQAKKDAYNDALDKIEYHSGAPTFDDGWCRAIDYIRKKFIRP